MSGKDTDRLARKGSMRSGAVEHHPQLCVQFSIISSPGRERSEVSVATRHLKSVRPIRLRLVAREFTAMRLMQMVIPQCDLRAPRATRKPDALPAKFHPC